MADFDPLQIPELALQRLDATAADCHDQAQAMFSQALQAQAELLTALNGPVTALMDAITQRIPELVEGPAKPEPGDGDGNGSGAVR